MGEKTEQKENETASPQNIKSKLNVLSEIVWTVNAIDLTTIGAAFEKGEYRQEYRAAVAGRRSCART